MEGCTPACKFETKEDKYWCAEHQAMHNCGADCTARFVGDEAQVHCKITGRVLGAFRALHPHHAVEHGVDLCNEEDKSKLLLVSKVPAHNTPLASVSKCRQIISTLLYSSARGMLSKRRESNMHAGIVREIGRRRKKMKKKKLKRVEIENIIREVNSQIHHICILKYNEARVNELTVNVMRVWRTLIKTPYFSNKEKIIRFDHVVIGLLYAMKKGWPPLFDCDEQLKCELPRATDIGKLGLKVRSVTIGKNHVFRACKFITSHQPPARESR